jgi:hypothetical protein
MARRSNAPVEKVRRECVEVTRKLLEQVYLCRGDAPGAG